MTSDCRILIVDDHALAREGLRAILGAAGYRIVGEAASAEVALELLETLEPELVLLDIRLGPGLDGLEAARRIRDRYPDIRVLMLTLHDSPEYVRAALEAGAAGYVLKDASLSDLQQAVEQVIRGQTAIPSGLLSRALRRDSSGPDLSALSRLTARETEILRQIVRGSTNKGIARELDISPATVKAHVERVLAKLNVTDRTQAAVLAARAGLDRS